MTRARRGLHPCHEKALGRLSREIATLCRGRTRLWCAQSRLLAEDLERRGIDVSTSGGTSGKGGSGPGEETFDTVVLAETLEYAGENEEALLLAAWRRVSARGRLVVCVPNEDPVADARQVRLYDRRRLRKQLSPLGKPKLVTGQPFRWLLMYVDRHRPLSRPVRERYRVIADLCHGNVIELGCGRGQLVEMIAQRGLDVTGLDLSAEKIALARERNPDVDFVQGDILAVSTAEERYDTVVMAEVIEHVSEDVGTQMLAVAWALVAPGGRLIVSVPNEDLVPHRNHLTRFDHRGLKQLLQRFSQPTLVTDQPLRWLLMYVDHGR